VINRRVIVVPHNREEARKVFRNADYYIVTMNDLGRTKMGVFPYLNLYCVTGDTLYQVVEGCKLWCEKKKAYRLAVWGEDRAFRLVYEVARELEIGLHELKDKPVVWL